MVKIIEFAWSISKIYYMHILIKEGEMWERWWCYVDLA